MKIFNRRPVLGGIISVALLAGVVAPAVTSCEKVQQLGISLTDRISAINKGLLDGDIDINNLSDLLAAALESLVNPSADFSNDIAGILNDSDTNLDIKIALLQEALRKDVIGGDKFAELLGKTLDVLPDNFWEDYSNIFVTLYTPNYDLSTKISIIESIINDGYLDNEQTLNGISESLEKLTGSSAAADAGIASLKATLGTTIAELEAIDSLNKQLTPELTEQVSDTLTDALTQIVSVNSGDADLAAVLAALQTDFDLLNGLLKAFI